MNIHQADYSDIHPYVFSPSGNPPTELDVTNSKVLASPFPVFSVEVDDGKLTVDKEGLGLDILCVFCKEISFDSYQFIVLVQAMGVDMVFEVSESSLKAFKQGRLVKDVSDGSMYATFKALVDSMLERLHSGRLGLFNASGKAKFKSANQVKKTYKPTDVIYIRDKSQAENVASKTGRNVNWKNTFEVSCHWRRIGGESLGKDRYGKRVVAGATWINSYQKGIGEIVTKLRKVTRKQCR
jgi:hypothetical protein